MLFRSMHESESEVTQSCSTLCDPIDCSLPDSSVHGIFQARVLEWGAIAFSAERLRGHMKNLNSVYRKVFKDTGMDHKGQGSIPKETIPSLKKSSLAPLKEREKERKAGRKEGGRKC